MWYASCSIGAHWISPSITVPGEVDDAGASAGPCSRGIPSGPIGPLAAAVVVPDEAAVELAAVLLVLDDDELPQPAIASAAHAAAAVRDQVFFIARGTVATPAPRGRASESLPTGGLRRRTGRGRTGIR